MGVSTSLDTDGKRGWPSPTSCGPLPLSYFVIPARPHPKTVKEKAPPDHSGGAHFVWADGREAYSSPSPSGRSSTITSSAVKSSPCTLPGRSDERRGGKEGVSTSSNR